MAMLNRFSIFRYSFSARLILSLSVIILLIFSISAGVTYKIQMFHFEQEVSKQYSKANGQALARLDMLVRDIYRIAGTISYHPDVEEVLTRSAKLGPDDYYERNAEQERLRDLLLQVKLDAPQLVSMYLIDLEGNSLYMDNSTNAVYEQDKGMYMQLKEELAGTSGNIVWKHNEIPSSMEITGYRPVIVASRWMKSRNLETYGMMSLVFDQTLLSSHLKELTSGGAGNVYLLSEEYKMLFSDDPDAPFQDLAGMLAGEEPYVIKADYLYSRTTSDTSGFTLISRISLNELEEKGKVTYLVSLYSAVVSIILGALLIVLASNRLLRPLGLLVQGMREVENGNFKTKVHIQTRDELAFLGEQFNKMASNIDQLIMEVYEQRLRKNEAELKMLHAQLNPHFLYNTLDMIYWSLYIKKDMETARVVVSLSEILRYSLESGKETASLNNELHQIRNYLKIQKERFKDQLETIVQVGPGLDSCSIIRLLLQPLVENIFVHAFRDKTGHRVVRIKVSRKNERLTVEIMDNGCGIAPDVLKKIITGHPDRQSDQRQRIGLRNVSRRIELAYGEPYGMEIVSVPERGTTITLTLPFIVEAEAAEKGEDGNDRKAADRG